MAKAGGEVFEVLTSQQRAELPPLIVEVEAPRQVERTTVDAAAAAAAEVVGATPARATVATTATGGDERWDGRPFDDKGRLKLLQIGRPRRQD